MCVQESGEYCLDYIRNRSGLLLEDVDWTDSTASSNAQSEYCHACMPLASHFAGAYSNMSGDPGLSDVCLVQGRRSGMGWRAAGGGGGGGRDVVRADPRLLLELEGRRHHRRMVTKVTKGQVVPSAAGRLCAAVKTNTTTTPNSFPHRYPDPPSPILLGPQKRSLALN